MREDSRNNWRDDWSDDWRECGCVDIFSWEDVRIKKRAHFNW